jgi:hypothetical protein
VGFNTFKEPVPQHVRDQRTESQNKSYIASETNLGIIAPVAVIEGEIISPRHGGAVGVAEQQRDHAKHIGGAPAGWRNFEVMPC